MFIFDILIVILVIAFIANGLRVGAIETLGRLVGSIVGFIAARSFAGWLVGLLSLFIPMQYAYLGSFLIIFLAVDSAIGFLFALADKILSIVTKLPIIKQIDGLLGAVFGLLESIIFIGGVAWLLQQIPSVAAKLAPLLALKTVSTINFIFQILLHQLL
jgi:uncharacterized membrane protein required for colicin V production